MPGAPALSSRNSWRFSLNIIAATCAVKTMGVGFSRAVSIRITDEQDFISGKNHPGK
jgi:hypothetical protein